MLGSIHSRYVHGRRVRVLCDRIAILLPESASVLDVGSGDGLLARAVIDLRPDVTIEGVDVLLRESPAITTLPPAAALPPPPPRERATICESLSCSCGF